MLRSLAGARALTVMADADRMEYSCNGVWCGRARSSAMAKFLAHALRARSPGRLARPCTFVVSLVLAVELHAVAELLVSTQPVNINNNIGMFYLSRSLTHTYGFAARYGLGVSGTHL